MKNPVRLLAILLLLVLPSVAQISSYLPTAPVSQQDQGKIHEVVAAETPTVLPDSFVVLPHKALSDGGLQANDDHAVAKEVPFKLFRGYLIVARGSVGRLKNLNFLIDTGAVPAVLDERIARKLHLNRQAEQIDLFTKKLQIKQAIAPEVRLGPLHAGELRVAILDLSFEREAVGTTVDAIVGYDLLGQGPFTIDYETKKIIVGPIDQSLARIPYHPDLPFAVVDLKIGGRNLPILVDTGTSDLVLFESGIRDCLTSVKVSRGEMWSNVGGELRVREIGLANTYLGTESWGSRKAYLLRDDGDQPYGFVGLLGTTALRARRVGFDPVRRVLAWEATKQQ
jgi:hypothetical protein